MNCRKPLVAAALVSLLLSAGCKGTRSSSIRGITCCAAYQDSDSLPLVAPPGTERIAIGGDSRDDRSHVVSWAFSEAGRRGAIAFLFLGDMELTRLEDRFFLRHLEQLRGIPFLPVIGNHEVEAFGSVRFPNGRRAVREFENEFLFNPGIQPAQLPEMAYSADVGTRIHIVALDNVSRRGGGFGEQLGWLARDLQAAKATHRVILVGMHKALAKNPITTHAMDEDGPAAVHDSDAALALFQQYGVAMVFVSHSHMYASYKQNGIPMKLTGGLGAPVVKGLSESDGGFHHFLLLDVAPAAQSPLRVEVVKFPGPTTRDQRDEADEGKD